MPDLHCNTIGIILRLSLVIMMSHNTGSAIAMHCHQGFASHNGTVIEVELHGQQGRHLQSIYRGTVAPPVVMRLSNHPAKVANGKRVDSKVVLYT